MTTTATDGSRNIGSLDDLYEALPALNYEPLWTMKGALTKHPETRMVPALWHYDEVRRLIMRAGELISAEEADRRVLAFKNPGCSETDLCRATDTLWGAIQLVLPGEVAPPHRHTPAALRYIIEGVGGYTIVDGRRVDMEPGDFLITPNWSSHEHGHGGSGPVLWLDGLDLPMVHSLHAGFAEFGGPPAPARARPVDAVRTGDLLPTWAGAGDAPTLVWKLVDVEAALEPHRETEGDPFDDLLVEYRNPATGGPALRTMSAATQLIRAGVVTRPHRHTSSHVYHVIRGKGTSTISGQHLEWSAGDTFALPTWAEHEHAASSQEDALLFSFSDEPALAALGLQRMEPCD